MSLSVLRPLAPAEAQLASSPRAAPAVELLFDSRALGEDRAASAAGHVYRERRAGKQVLALVPDARHGDRLINACDRVGLRTGRDFVVQAAGRTAHSPARSSDRQLLAAPLRVAIAGFGTVGQAVADRLRHEPGFDIVSVLVRDRARSRAVKAPVGMTDDANEFLDSGADLLIEATSCEDIGGALCEAALRRSIGVATASKRVVSTRKGELDAAAAIGGGSLAYSAAVGGGAPIIEMIDRCRGQGEIRSIQAILNGTTNYILDRIASGRTGEEALIEARQAGFAEENSDYDLSGEDAAAKLRIIALHAFGLDPTSVHVSTEWLDADRIARIEQSRERWVHLASISREAGEVRASVALVPQSQAARLPDTPAEWNAASIQLADGREFVCAGRGAGGSPTAEAVIADLYDLRASMRPDVLAPLSGKGCA